MGALVKPYLTHLSSMTRMTSISRHAKPLQMRTFGERLAHARRLRGLKQRHLSEHFGVTTSAISQWEHNIAYPDGARLIELPKLLSVSPLWLLYNVGLPEQAGNDTLGPSLTLVGGRKVPRIGALRAAHDFREAIAETDDFVLPIDSAGADGDFAIDIWDDSNSPEMVRGDYVFIRPGIKAAPGDYVFAAVGPDRTPVIGQLGRSATGGWDVVHANPLWGRRSITSTADEIIGIRIAHVRAIRR